jgi:hypothetical protein
MVFGLIGPVGLNPSGLTPSTIPKSTSDGVSKNSSALVFRLKFCRLRCARISGKCSNFRKGFATIRKGQDWANILDT